MADQGFGVNIAFQSGYFAQVLNIQFSGMERVPLETTHTLSTEGWKTYIPSDLKDAGEAQITLRWHPHTKIAAALAALTAAPETITITFPVPEGGTSGAVFQCSGFLTKRESDTPYDAIMGATETIKFTGKPTMTAGS